MPKVKIARSGNVYFKCPGCHHWHFMNIDPKAGRPAWEFNGNLDLPTLKPSILVTCGHYVTGQPQPPDCWHCNNADEVDKYNAACMRCHSFVTDGMIQFLADCTHKFAGKTVPLIEVTDAENPY